MPVKFLSLSSGSSGNCYYLSDGEVSILIDAGVSLRAMKSRLGEHSIQIQDIDAVLVTHDHLDHIRHLGSFIHKYSRPVYATSRLCGALKSHTFTAGTVDACLRVCEYGRDTVFKGIVFRPLQVPHDATDTVGYYLEFSGQKILVLTDAGRVTDEAADFARKANHIVVESNYDMDMLMRGNYTRELKERIMGGRGHLSNDDCASFIRRIWHKDIRNIFLCHLSENNNTPSAAYKAASDALASMGVAPGECLTLYPLPRRGPSHMMVFDAG